MNFISKKATVLVLPFLVVGLLSFKVEKTEGVWSDFQFPLNSTTNYSQLDSFPPLPANLIGEEIDTIFTFDPVSKKVAITYGKSKDWPAPTTISKPKSNGIDTIYTFDSTTGKETITIIDNNSKNKK